MKKKNNDNSVMINKLYDHCEEFTETTIACVKCGIDKTLHTDAYYASENFYNEGWRIIRGNKCYCPDCAKK